jgi:hypothetical protein|tara:strand:+ start:185 stop:334 length:150 start_codon:yes stop_codon:yes gene_type:complete
MLEEEKVRKKREKPVKQKLLGTIELYKAKQAEDDANEDQDIKNLLAQAA